MALIEDQELEQLRQRASQADSALASKNLLDAMGKNPKTRMQILRLMKEMNPDLAIPEIDAAKPVLDKVAELEKRLADKEKAEAEEKEKRAKEAQQQSIEDTIRSARKRLRDDGWTKEGIEAVEKMMQERGLADYDAAAALYEKEHPKEEAIVPSDFGRDSGLFDPPEGNPWRDAVSLPKGAKQERALRSAQSKEIQKWFAENRPQHRMRA